MYKGYRSDFILKEYKEIIYPGVSREGLVFYYDTKGKKNTDTYRDILLDMSGAYRNGKLEDFKFNKGSGYEEDRLVFDGADDKLIISGLNQVSEKSFTYLINNNIMSFDSNDVRWVENGNIKKANKNLVALSDFRRPSSFNFYQKEFYVTNSYANVPGVKVKDFLKEGQEYTISFTHELILGTYNAPDISGCIRFYDPKAEKVIKHFRAESGEEFKETFIMDSISDSLELYIYGTSTGVIKFKELKIEEGNTQTKWTPHPRDLIQSEEIKGNILGDLENIVDSIPRDKQSGKEVHSKYADDSYVHVEVDGKTTEEKLSDGRFSIKSLNNFDIISSFDKDSFNPEEINEYDEVPGINKVSIILPEPLRSLGDVCDRLIYKENKWRIERNIEITGIEDGSRSINDIYSISEAPIYNTLPDDYQSKLNNLKSFEESTYVYTTNELDPTIYALFQSKDYLKKNRTVTNLILWSRSLSDDEMLKHNKFFLNRFDLASEAIQGELINQKTNLSHGYKVAHSLSQKYTINI